MYPRDNIITFADLRWGNGHLYQTTGWTLDKIIPPDYSYSYSGGIKRIHKFNFRRNRLACKLRHFDPALSERENCDAAGMLRIWDCGKMRFMYEA